MPDFPGFSKVIGPGIVWLALAQGSGELIWWPYLTAKYGTALLFLLIPSALIQMPLTYNIGKYSMMTGESIWRGFMKVSRKFTALLWIVMNISFFWFGSFVVAGGTALSELLPLGIGKKAESIIWGYALIITMFMMLMFSKKTYEIIEKFMWFVAVGTFIGLIISCVHPDVIKMVPEFILGFFRPAPNTLSPEDYEETITAITFMGLGGFWSLFYSYWILDKGFGMAKLEDKEGVIPAQDESLKEKVRKWNKALLFDSSLGIVGNIITTLMTCLLAYAVLHPRGLIPEGYKIAVVQSEFFRGWFGEAGVKIFLFSSALFLIDTWITTADAVAKINIDIIKGYLKLNDEKKLYKILLVAITLITCITLPIAPPGELIVFSAMVGFVGMVVFSALILYLIYVLLAWELPKDAKPSKSAFLFMLLSSIAYTILFVIYMKLKIT